MLARLAGIGMLAKRKVQVRPAGQHRLRMRELAEAPFAVVRAHAGMPRAVERNALHHHVDADFIDAAAAELQRGHHALRPFFCPP